MNNMPRNAGPIQPGTLTLTVTTQEAQLILNAMSEVALPFKLSNPIITKIMHQARDQHQAATANEPENVYAEDADEGTIDTPSQPEAAKPE